MQEEITNIRWAKLMEREKELNCLYSVENLLKDDEKPIKLILKEIVNVIPPGYQYTTVCEARILFEDSVFTTEDFTETEWMQHADIIVDEHVAGRIDVAYTQLIRLHRGSAFLPEEQKLLNTIASNIGRTIFRRKLKTSLDYIHQSERPDKHDENLLYPESDEHWKWRYKMAESIASAMDLDRFGVKGIYLVGSTKNASAGPASDIDLILHFTGSESQKNDIATWLEGWGLCLDQINYSRTGYHSGDSLIDVHIVTDEDFRIKDSYAMMIGAVTDGARLLKKKS